jgi:hypothetical protein
MRAFKEGPRLSNGGDDVMLSLLSALLRRMFVFEYKYMFLPKSWTQGYELHTGY